jgi:hypothetical protein
MSGKDEKREGPLTLSQLAKFYNDLIDPRFQKVDERFDRIETRLDEYDGRFDDLYKKFEDLHQEYVISNEQIRRLAGDLRKLN